MRDAFGVIEGRALAKSFGGVVALEDVSVSVRSGEILAVIGENGAGKSTLMKVLCGVHHPDGGEVFIDGETVTLTSPADAFSRGIAIIPQELELCESLTVVENVLLGREPRSRGGFLDSAAAAKAARRALDEVALDVPLDQPTAELGHGQRQLVAIARALGGHARVLLLDEPTATLSTTETKLLLARLEEMRAGGAAIVLITHRLAEVEKVADRVVVLRDGAHVCTLVGEQIERDLMVRNMVGRELAEIPAEEKQLGEVRLAIEGLKSNAHPASIDLEVRGGERVALAGLVGAGRSELLESLFGLRPRDGTVTIDGALLPPLDPHRAVEAGVALVPEERGAQGLALEQTVAFNAALPGLYRQGAAGGWLPLGAGEAVGSAVVEQMEVRPADPSLLASALSGGNQQKVVIGKWLILGPGVLLLDEPTRGVDVGAREEIHQRLRELSAEGVAILFASSEMEEVLALADRVVVLNEGRVSAILDGSEATEEGILHLATCGGER